MKYNNVLGSIGNTPHIKLNRLYGSDHEVWVKLEKANPGGSIKDRIALSMIEDAERMEYRNWVSDGCCSKRLQVNSCYA